MKLGDVTSKNKQGPSANIVISPVHYGDFEFGCSMM